MNPADTETATNRVTHQFETYKHCTLSLSLSHTHTHSHTDTRTHTTSISIRDQRAHTHTHAHTQMHTYTQTISISIREQRAHTHTHTHTQMHTYTHTHTHKCTHTHTPYQDQSATRESSQSCRMCVWALIIYFFESLKVDKKTGAVQFVVEFVIFFWGLVKFACKISQKSVL